MAPIPKRSKQENILKFTDSDYSKCSVDLAKALLGQTLVRKLRNGDLLKAIIVECEAYPGPKDVASHSFKGPTPRNGAMFMKPGTAYVYRIYGMYQCFNISSQEVGGAVLIRAAEPSFNIEKIRELRDSARKSKTLKTLKDTQLCNGPSKLCQSLAIDVPSINEEDMTTSSSIWIESGVSLNEDEIIVCKRIGIDGAGEEAASKLWRFYIKSNAFVSVRDRLAENLTSKPETS